MPRQMPEKPKGLKNVFTAGVGAAENILGLTKKMQTVMYVVIAVVGLVIIAVVGTFSFGVATDRIDVNQLADSGARMAESGAKIATRV